MNTVVSKAQVFFVFGAMRSGTTMFRLMLDAHGDVYNPGEVDLLFDFLSPDPSHPTGWRYDLEAMQKHRIFKSRKVDVPLDCDGLDLLNHMIDQLSDRSTGTLTLSVHRNAEKMAKLLPDARIIHFLRDPRDVANSTIGMGWAGISYFGINDWIDTEQGWNNALPDIAPERLLTVKFEDLLTNLETELRKVCEFLGVPFSLSMLAYHKNTTYAPPDPKLAEQWRKKSTPREIALVEGKCGHLITARGYALNGKPINPGKFEQFTLGVKNRSLRWRYNINRYGASLFFSALIAKRFGSKSMNDRVRLRMDDVITKGLK